MSSCLHPSEMVNPRWDARRSDKAKFRLDTFRQFHPGEIYPVDYKIMVPCGKCSACLKDRARMWRVRLLHECAYGNHDSCVAITLTISNDYYDQFKEKDKLKACIRGFLDRLRYYCAGRKLPKRFFVTELGEEHDRLHFHGFLWDLRCAYADVRRCWKYGFVWIDQVRSIKQFSYVTKYITKADIKFHIPQVYVSPGLGKGYTEQERYVEWHKGSRSSGPRFFCQFGDFRYSLPVYYRRKMFTDAEAYLGKVRLSQSDRPFQKVLASRLYTDERQFYQVRARLYEVSLRKGKSQPIIPPKDKDLKFKQLLQTRKNVDFPEIEDCSAEAISPQPKSLFQDFDESRHSPAYLLPECCGR